MRARVPLALFASLSFAAAALAAGQPKGPWEGFGVGSWVQVRTTGSGKMPNGGDASSVSESKETLTAATDAEWTVTTQSKTATGWSDGVEWKVTRAAGTPSAPASPAAAKALDLGTEPVTLEGRAFPCKKTRTTTPFETVTTWVSEEQGELRRETTTPYKTATTTEVTALSKGVKVGDKEVACRETRTVAKLVGSETTVVSLTSDAVPRHVVRTEATTVRGALTTTSVTEVVAFEAK